MTQRILVLFPDEWDRAAASAPRHAGRFEFLFEGFDLFSFPDNARLFTFDALAFVDRLARKYRNAGIAGIVTSDEQFGPFVASLVAGRLGLGQPAPCRHRPPLAACNPLIQGLYLGQIRFIRP